MAVESTSVGSLEKSIDLFQSRLQRVELGLKLLDVLHYSVDGKFSLEEISSDVGDLKAINEVIRSKIDTEKKKLELMSKQRERLNEVRRRMNYICYHLPEGLPDGPRPQISNKPPHPNDQQPQHEQPQVLVNKENKKPINPPKGKQKIKCINALKIQDFEGIPKHVKSHLQMEQINVGIAEVNLMLEKKYEFLKRPRKSLTRSEEKKRSVYLEMGKDLKGTAYEIFIMDSDIQQHGGVMKTKPKTRETVFLVLRHLGKMKEIRKGKPPRYCILGG